MSNIKSDPDRLENWKTKEQEKNLQSIGSTIIKQGKRLSHDSFRGPKTFFMFHLEYLEMNLKIKNDYFFIEL